MLVNKTSLTRAVNKCETNVKYFSVYNPIYMNKVSTLYVMYARGLEPTHIKAFCNVVQWIQVFGAGFDRIYTILMGNFI